MVIRLPLKPIRELSDILVEEDGGIVSNCLVSKSKYSFLGACLTTGREEEPYIYLIDLHQVKVVGGYNLYGTFGDAVSTGLNGSVEIVFADGYYHNISLGDFYLNALPLNNWGNALWGEYVTYMEDLLALYGMYYHLCRVDECYTHLSVSERTEIGYTSGLTIGIAERIRRKEQEYHSRFMNND